MGPKIAQLKRLCNFDMLTSEKFYFNTKEDEKSWLF